MSDEIKRTSIEHISERMITQRKIPMMLIHGECNEKIKYKDANETYIYFKNMYSSKPNNFMFFMEE